MEVQPTALPGVMLLDAHPTHDERGSFARLWDPSALRPGADVALELLCASWNPTRGTLRGLHWQQAPAEETKVVRCTRGRVFDVAVDVRPDSPAHLRWFGVELAAGDRRAVYLPAGVAHGFLTVEDDSEVEYLMTSTYDPARARGLRYDDPALAITWPEEVRLVSNRDRTYPLLPR